MKIKGNWRFFIVTTINFEYDRTGVSTLAQISAFLGGLFFSALLLLIQQKTEHQKLIFCNPQISEIQIIVIPLTVSVVLFVLSSFFLGVSCSVKSDTRFIKMANAAMIPFILGFLTFFVSLICVLLLADIFAGIIGTVIAIILTVWWFNIDKTD
ncbi:MAG: hypothetical protein ACYDDV_02495 [Methanoregula sp.]